LYRDHQKHARTVAGRYLDIPGMSSDEIYALADLALWDAANSFAGQQGNFEAYSTVVIQNRLIDEVRKAKKRETHEAVVEPASPFLESAGNGSPVEDSVAQKESKEILHGVLRQLPARDAEVLLRSADGESYSSIASSLGVSKQMVGKICISAREAAKESISSKGYIYERTGNSTILCSQGGGQDPSPPEASSAGTGEEPGRRFSGNSVNQTHAKPSLLLGIFRKLAGLFTH